MENVSASLGLLDTNKMVAATDQTQGSSAGKEGEEHCRDACSNTSDNNIREKEHKKIKS